MLSADQRRGFITELKALVAKYNVEISSDYDFPVVFDRSVLYTEADHTIWSGTINPDTNIDLYSGYSDEV